MQNSDYWFWLVITNYVKKKKKTTEKLSIVCAFWSIYEPSYL